MAQITTSQIQACPTVSLDAEAQYGELHLAFEQQAEQWHKHNDLDENVDPAVVGFVMMPEKMLPPIELKADIGRIGEGQIGQENVTPQLLMLASVAVIHPEISGKTLPRKTVLLTHEAVINTVSHAESHVFSAAPTRMASISISNTAAPLAAPIFPSKAEKAAPKVGTAMSVSKAALTLALTEPAAKAISSIATTAVTAKVAPTVTAAVTPTIKAASEIATTVPVVKAAQIVAIAAPLSKVATSLAMSVAESKTQRMVVVAAPASKAESTAAVMATASSAESMSTEAVTLSKAAPAAAIVKPVSKTDVVLVAASPVATTKSAIASIKSEEAQTRPVVAAELSGHKPAPRQELTFSGMNASTFPLIDVRASPIVHTQSEEQPSPYPVAQLLTSRQASQSGVLKGSEMTFRFSKWGDGHTVKVQTKSSGYASQLTLQPSDALVAHRLSEHLSISAPPDHWTLLKDDEEHGHRQQPGQPHDEGETT
ncbi:type III secretion system needle length determinant, SpaN/EivJ family [Glaciimonas sp. PCH181]|uniref:SpaN/EivJ family type III secretion system needle length determinant n=1 Tax=Glaciimonas sp. PCH181 TaxID=2133943 RepID=UPI000D39390E|nr:type III secretion system needle length determinant, SpaN/EivJ family [Glaciimonas sp. PCH181]PUA19950.1 hypothetical protein C7W93_09120 [Glaciimonas sp. PCH181]